MPHQPLFLRLFSLTLVALASLSGCYGNEPTEFPPGLEPLEEMLVDAPIGTADNPYPEGARFLRNYGATTLEQTPAVQMHAYIHAPIAKVWEGLRELDIIEDRRALSRYSIMDGIEDEYDYSYIIHEVVEDIITVEYDITWRHGAIVGTVEEPEVVAITYQKTFGSTIVYDLRGSIVLRQLEDDVTEIEFIQYLRTVQNTHESTEGYMRDLFAELLLFVDDQPLPPIAELETYAD